MKDASDLFGTWLEEDLRAVARRRKMKDLKGLLTICVIQRWEVSGGCRSGMR